MSCCELAIPQSNTLTSLFGQVQGHAHTNQNHIAINRTTNVGAAGCEASSCEAAFCEASRGAAAHLYIGRENDHESNLGFFGVRQYDPTYRRFMSVDPLWAKYAPLQPYHYAGKEPVGRLDWDGRDYDVVIENGTITISAVYFVKQSDKEQLEKALETIKRDLNGKNKVIHEGVEYIVALDLTAVVVDDPIAALNESRSEKFDDNGYLVDETVATNTNTYISVERTPTGEPGETLDGRRILVQDSRNSVSVHEVLHTLGLHHNKFSGALTESVRDPGHSDKSWPSWRALMIDGSDYKTFSKDYPLGIRTFRERK